MSTEVSSRRTFLRLAGAAAATASTCRMERGAAATQSVSGSLSAADTDAIDLALGKKGTAVPDQAVYTVALPRNDLKVTLKGEPIPIPFGFGGWVSFKKTRDGKSTVLMSDTVLLQEEVNGVISAAQSNGIEITGIHNHFFYEEPRIFYMHVHAMGTAADLAGRYAAAIRGTKLFPANQPPPGAPPPLSAGTPARTGREIFDLPRLDGIVGAQAAVNGPTCKYTIGRKDLTVVAMGAEITAAIGLNSWAAFAGTMERAHVAGDVAMLDAEVNPVIRVLRQNNLEVVALHNHMLGEQPRMTFLHYLGTGPAEQLARSFRAALDVLGSPGSRPHG